MTSTCATGSSSTFARTMFDMSGLVFEAAGPHSAEDSRSLRGLAGHNPARGFSTPAGLSSRDIAGTITSTVGRDAS
ncbi:hypothetical protein CSHISOI_04647 [Colletotrichum shisoi]|uniref:Uncharacterized protein n=1 Tax=Colletotrichum shisoi TaxID=2078593 RepID=A0A5Q4BW13_9PEZI|nr:hypothetical protein CSHISOI_04647 [Colletotrichum shisoi]